MTTYDLGDFTTPIVSGLTPADGGRLSAAREAALLRDLAALRLARQRAAVESRNYLVTGVEWGMKKP